MPDFKKIISDHETRVNELHNAVHAAFKIRDRSDRHKEKWQQAALENRYYKSQVDELIAACQMHGIEHDPELRRFVFDYLIIDPYYFRSGYTMERLVQRIKKLQLTSSEKAIIQNLLLHRIETRALRNFRNICRLIHRVETEGFHTEVCHRSKSIDPGVKRRADFALLYFSFKGRKRGDGFIMI